MAKFDSLIFDLDGTLWDTCAACAIAWNNVLCANAIPFRKIVAQDVRSVAGKPHEQCIREVFVGVPEAQIQILIRQTSIEDNRVISERGGELYSDVGAGLRTLSERYPLYIVSNCQVGYIEIFLHGTGFSPLFKDFECWGNTGRSKAENIKLLVERNALRAPVYIGDTQGDADAARANQIRFVYVMYGFGQVDITDMSFRSFADLCQGLLIL